MAEEIAGRYAGYTTSQLFELARAGESRFRPEAWQALKDELRKRGLELTPEDEALASGSTTGGDAPSYSEPVGPVGVNGWLALFVVMVGLSAVLRAYQTLGAFIALAWTGVLYGAHAVVLVIGLVLVYHRDPLAPRYWRNLLILTAGVDFVLAAAHLMSGLLTLVDATVLIGWAAYWTKSRRVRATFATRPLAEVATEVDAFSTSSEAQDEGDAEPVPSIDDLNAELDDARRQGNMAAVYVVMGLAVTMGTYFMALAGGGRTYFIAWGAILFGLYGAARASWRKKRARALLENAVRLSS